MDLLPRLTLGLVLSATIAVLAYRRQALSVSGALGAVVTGTIIFGFGGWSWGILLITFFVLSTLLSKYREGTKERLAEKFAKGSRRDLGQVLANSGAGALMALAYLWYPTPELLLAYSGAMATVNADTWATELGVLARRRPRLITTGESVEPGTSGAISVPGTLATLAGGTTIGVATALLVTTLGAGTPEGVGVAPVPGGWWVMASALGGVAGSLFDSMLGATVQAVYYAQARAKETEKPIDPDGSPNRLIRGWRWLNNDWVNFLSSIVGALVSVGAYKLLS